MLAWLWQGGSMARASADVYARIVAQARAHALYARLRVPDTMDGRLEMILLHTVLVLDRLRGEGRPAERIGQRLMEHLVADIDDALRRIGIGDDGVAHRIPRLAGALAERARDYGPALAVAQPARGADDPLAAALAGHVGASALSSARAAEPASSPAPPDAAGLAAYARAARDRLAATAGADVLAGRITFPEVGRAVLPIEETTP